MTTKFQTLNTDFLATVPWYARVFREGDIVDAKLCCVLSM